MEREKKTVYRFPLEMQNKMQKTQNIHEFDIREIRKFATCEMSIDVPYVIQGGSNMTGTDLGVNKPHLSRSYLNHLVHYFCFILEFTEF